MKDIVMVDNNNGVAELIENGSNIVVGRLLYNVEKGQVHIEYPANTTPEMIQILNQKGMELLKAISVKKGLGNEINATLDLEAHYFDKDGNKVPLRFED